MRSKLSVIKTVPSIVSQGSKCRYDVVCVSESICTSKSFIKYCPILINSDTLNTDVGDSLMLQKVNLSSMLDLSLSTHLKKEETKKNNNNVYSN